MLLWPNACADSRRDAGAQHVTTTCPPRRLQLAGSAVLQVLTTDALLLVSDGKKTR